VPEGDTVWLAARRLHAALAGQVVTRSDLRVPALALTDLRGQTVLEVLARGKHLLTRFSGGLTLHTHLRMEGSWRLHPPGGSHRGHGVRIVLSVAGADAVGVRIPVIDLGPTQAEEGWVGHLGPDVLDPHFDLPEVLRRLRTAPQRTIGEALLDQSVLAGPGNINRTEALFLHGVTPFTPVGEVRDLPRLLTRVRELMWRNRETGEQSTTGAGRGQEHWVYGRGGRSCMRCGHRVSEVALGPPGQQRRTAWCPHCQAGPST
jgi:endonuclease-8